MTESPFEVRRELPDEELASQGSRLIGFPRRLANLRGQLRLLTDADGVRDWAQRYHNGGFGLVAAIGDRYPLVIFHGDVGTGKSASAEAAADALARDLDVEGYLLKLSTRVRGVGHVGEMSTLISAAFDEAITLAGKSRFVTIIVDEGDALAFDRSAERAHHEDRVGVNTMIQKIDDSRRLRGRLLTILCTNRFGSLDPAIIRRAAVIETFRRPDAAERRELFQTALAGTAITSEDIETLVMATGEQGQRPGFTFSDIQTRLIPAAIARAYPAREIRGSDLLSAANELRPSPAISDLEG